jgi:VWFA-related protein
MRAVLVILGCAFAVTAQEAAQEENVPIFRSQVSLVRVDARVTDPSGRDIGGLKQGDFVIHDENDRREVLDVTTESERDRVDVVLLLDVSGSMWQHLRELGATTASALGQLKPGARVALMEFASRTQVVQPFTEDYRLVERRITETIFKQTLGRDTFVNEAVAAAAEYLRKNSEPKTRRFVIVVSDNAGTRSSVTDAQALKSVQSANAVLNAIVVGEAPTAGETLTTVRFTDPEATGFPDLSRYAQATGGMFVTSSRVGEALRDAVGDIRTRYQLHYSAPAGSVAGKFRRIKVELTPEARQRYAGAVIAAREGYYAAQ